MTFLWLGLCIVKRETVSVCHFLPRLSAAAVFLFDCRSFERLMSAGMSRSVVTIGQLTRCNVREDSCKLRETWKGIVLNVLST